MSRAFVKEDDNVGIEPLPDRPVSPHPNLVTEEGLAAIERILTELQHRLAAALAAKDPSEQGTIGRELRYWNARRSGAQVIKTPQSPSEVVFGSTVTIRRGDGHRQAWRIVGEDEADPSRGTLSYVSPVARALLGKQIGDVVQAGKSDVDILDIA